MKPSHRLLIRYSLSAVLSVILWLAGGAQLGLAQSIPTKPAARAYGLMFFTYLGGSGGELLRDMTVDAQGNIHVAGIAGAADFPRTPPATRNVPPSNSTTFSLIRGN